MAKKKTSAAGKPRAKAAGKKPAAAKKRPAKRSGR